MEIDEATFDPKVSPPPPSRTPNFSPDPFRAEIKTISVCPSVSVFLSLSSKVPYPTASPLAPSEVILASAAPS